MLAADAGRWVENMDFNDKLNAALRVLGSTGMRRINYAPSLFVFLWRKGIQIPPPHFNGFLFNFLFFSISFGAILAMLVGLISWSQKDLSSFVEALSYSMFCGIIFGSFVSIYFLYGARKYSIPKWSKFQPANYNEKSTQHNG